MRPTRIALAFAAPLAFAAALAAVPASAQPFPPPPGNPANAPPAQPGAGAGYIPGAGFSLVCNTLELQYAFNADQSLVIRFIKEPFGADAVEPPAGQCAWRDRPVNDAEPNVLFVPAEVSLTYDFFRALRFRRIIQFRAYNANNGSMIVTMIEGP